MILTEIPLEQVPGALATVRARLLPGSLARRVLDRVSATLELVPHGVDTPEHRRQAIELAHAFGIGTLDEAPQDAFSWDGRVIRTRSEAYVLIHEVAHWLVCPPERRHLIDFGLGAGPESGRPDEANAAIAVDKETQIEEEALSSLLGILWEAELGQPAILAFLEQNWLEGWERPACAENLVRNIELLRSRGLIRADGRPCAPETFAVKRARAV
ncbi:MAG TPA: hypothetical protein VED40_16680 [Azospirillaceae bacterium]|nr:hypothetical protein [Azospirillaceae bacterium]